MAFQLANSCLYSLQPLTGNNFTSTTDSTITFALFIELVVLMFGGFESCTMSENYFGSVSQSRAFGIRMLKMDVFRSRKKASMPHQWNVHLCRMDIQAVRLLYTRKLFGFNFVMYFTPIQCQIRPKLFPHFALLLYNYSSTSHLEKPFSIAHWCGKYLCQVSLKSLQQIWRYHDTHIKC